MAEAAVFSALITMGKLVASKVLFLQGVKREVNWLKRELAMLQSNLEDAAQKQGFDRPTLTWISQVREVAQEADDAVERFILKVDTLSSKGAMQMCLYFPIYLYHLNRVGEKIVRIKGELQQVTNLGEKNKILDRILNTPSDQNVDGLSSSSQGRGEDQAPVGLDEDVRTIKGRILEEREGPSIVVITGTRGVGKSTLAGIVYKDVIAAVNNQFNCFAWVCASRKSKPRIIMELMEELMVLPIQEEPVASEAAQLIRLKVKLQEHLLDKQYFIVIDDLRQTQDWEDLKSAFPDNKESRLLLTSRTWDDAKVRCVHQLKPLAPEVSRRLLLRKAIPSGNTGEWPNGLESLGTNILEKCNHLPLAITRVADVLARQGPPGEAWEKVLKSLNLYLAASRDAVKATSELSYHNLSPQLKSCFLCLGFFNESSPIHAEKLVQVWIAEGLVSHEGLEEEETLEDRARGYLGDLINQNMVQVTEKTPDDQVKKCHIQESLLNLSIQKAQEEISLEILKEESSRPSDKPRHRSVYCSRTMNQNKLIRSLFFHVLGNVNGSPPKWKSFELLRVLDLENFGLQELPDGIGELIGLRYLGLRNNNIRRLPRSLGRLRKLEVLDIALNLMIEFPKVIWNMESLRHLYMSGIKCKVPLEIDMKNLQTLLYIPVAYWKANQMTSLKKLGIALAENSNVSELFASLDELQKLVHLNLRVSYDQVMPSLGGLDILRRLTKLKLHGQLTSLPSVFPPRLSFLSLVQTYLNDDPTPILEKLEGLKYLKLHQAYTGQKMEISNNGFQSLEVLSLHKLVGLNNLEVANGALGNLKRLDINLCRHLETLPAQVITMNQLKLNMVTTNEIALRLRGEQYFCKINIKSVNLDHLVD